MGQPVCFSQGGRDRRGQIENLEHFRVNVFSSLAAVQISWVRYDDAYLGRQAHREQQGKHGTFWRAFSRRVAFRRCSEDLRTVVVMATDSVRSVSPPAVASSWLALSS